MTEQDAADIYLDEELGDGQVELVHWREAARRRAEEETRRAARQRRRLLLVVGAVVLALLVGLIGWKVISAARARTPEEIALGGKRASVLFQLRARDGGADEVDAYADELAGLRGMLVRSQRGDVIGVTALGMRAEVFAWLEGAGAKRLTPARVKTLVRRAGTLA